MAMYHYAAYFQTPLHQSPAALPSHHPLGISSSTSNLATSPAKSQTQDTVTGPPPSTAIKAKGVILQQQQSLLFRLPAELRNSIFSELLCPHAPSIKALAQRTTHQAPKPPPLSPAILLTCRKAHSEASDLLYTTHIFRAHPSLLTSLPHLTSPAAPVLYPSVIAKIRRWHLTIRLDTDPRFTAEQAAAAFSGAEYLEIRAWQSMFDGVDCEVLKLFLGVRGVGIARVGGSAGAELARWLEGRMMRRSVEEGEEGLCGGCREGGGGEGVCGCCREDAEVDGEWFVGRNAWQFGNR